MFFSIFARNLQRSEILIVGILIEKGAASRPVVLRTSKLLTLSGLPSRTVESTISRLVYLRIVAREKSGSNFQYRVSLANVRKLKQPTFPDRTSLTAQLSFDGFGRMPSRIRFVGEEKSFSVADATLEDLRRFQKQLAKQAENRVRRNERLEQTAKLINLMGPYDAAKPGITVKEIVALEKESRGDEGATAKLAQKSTAASSSSQT
jgi:hypothetical protein